jgi:chromosome segregation ATPase
MRVFDDLRVCMLALSVQRLDTDVPREWAAKASTLVLETQRTDDNRRAMISGSNVAWTINGRAGPQDSLAHAWQKAVVDLADAVYEADQLRARDAMLRLEIDSLPVRVARTKSRIAYVEKMDSDLNLRIMNAGREENAIRAQIRQVENARSSAEARAASARSRANSGSQQDRAAAEAAARSYEQQAMNLSRQADDLNRKLMYSNASRTVAAAQEELRALRPEHTLALLKLELSGYEATNAADIEREIQQLDARTRQPLLDVKVDAALARLRAILR